MGFIRIKTIKKNKYAYIVKNKWTKKGPRQKSKKYLGRVYTMNLNSEDQKDFINLLKEPLEQYLSKEYDTIVNELIIFELIQRGFIQKRKIIRKGDLLYNPKLRKLKTIGKKDYVLEINDGHLCNYTINRLLKFYPESDDEREAGIEMAKLFVEAGLKIPKEVFVGLFEKKV